jgi:DALR anticodon binding domain
LNVPVSLSFSSFPSLSLRSLLIDRIQAAIEAVPIDLPASKAETAIVSENSRLLPQPVPPIAFTEIPLNRLKVAAPIRYVSAIAFRLAHQPGIDAAPIAIAQAIAEQLQPAIAATQPSENPDALGTIQPLAQPLAWRQAQHQVWQNVTVQAAEPGWIYLQLGDRGVAIWLQSLIGSQIHLSSSTRSDVGFSKKSVASDAYNTRNSTRMFPLLYTHARCCSLLRLANQTGIIRLDRTEFTVSAENSTVNSTNFNSIFLSNSPFGESHAFPWLSQPEDHLRCQHPAEQQLISQLVNALDQLEELPLAPDQLAPDPLAQCRKLAQALSQDFQTFFAACRIWGEVERTDLPLAQARLGLVLIVQKVMRSLLAELGIEAPTEL